jgi:Zn finger protein HypA/HybF involved in hydrogenase expression
MSKLKIDKELLDGVLTAQLAGTIDEDADFTPLQGLSQPSVIFDFHGVTMLNSCGIREWVSFIAKLPPTTRVTYRRCPQIIIEQINMVHGFFREGALIESFAAPYYCEHCDKESKVLLKTSQVQNRKAPTQTCPHCGEANMEFDALEEQYFHFLKNQG